MVDGGVEANEVTVEHVELPPMSGISDPLDPVAGQYSSNMLGPAADTDHQPCNNEDDIENDDDDDDAEDSGAEMDDDAAAAAAGGSQAELAGNATGSRSPPGSVSQ